MFDKRQLLGISNHVQKSQESRPMGRDHSSSSAAFFEKQLESPASLERSQERWIGSEAETFIRTQIVEKHGRRLWEDKHSSTFKEELTADIRMLLESQMPLSSIQLETEVKRLLHSLTGWGALDELLEDQDITEIMFHRHNYLVVER
ncbi:CpaF family protein, partial [Mesorhizobium sp. M00.F.Ca.ET.186.01.1.1]